MFCKLLYTHKCPLFLILSGTKLSKLRTLLPFCFKYFMSSSLNVPHRGMYQFDMGSSHIGSWGGGHPRALQSLIQKLLKHEDRIKKCVVIFCFNACAILRAPLYMGKHCSKWSLKFYKKYCLTLIPFYMKYQLHRAPFMAFIMYIFKLWITMYQT